MKRQRGSVSTRVVLAWDGPSPSLEGLRKVERIADVLVGSLIATLGEEVTIELVDWLSDCRHRRVALFAFRVVLSGRDPKRTAVLARKVLNKGAPDDPVVVSGGDDSDISWYLVDDEADSAEQRA